MTKDTIIKKTITFDVQTTLTRTLLIDLNKDIWDSVYEYVNSLQFYEDLKHEFEKNGEIDWEIIV